MKAKSCLYSNLIILTDFHSFTRNEANIKIIKFSRFLLRSEYPIQVKIWKWLKLLNSVPFIKKTLVNQVYIRIWSFWLKTVLILNCKTQKRRSRYAIHVKIWKWLKLLNSVHQETTFKFPFEFDHFDWFYSESNAIQVKIKMTKTS